MNRFVLKVFRTGSLGTFMSSAISIVNMTTVCVVKTVKLQGGVVGIPPVQDMQSHLTHHEDGVYNSKRQHFYPILPPADRVKG